MNEKHNKIIKNGSKMKMKDKSEILIKPIKMTKITLVQMI